MKVSTAKFKPAIFLILAVAWLFLLKSPPSYKAWIQNSAALTKKISDLEIFSNEPEFEPPYVAPELPIQTQIYMKKKTKANFDIFTALCDERMTSFSARTAVHIFMHIYHRFEETDETRARLRATWKCRMFFNDKSSVDLPVSAVIQGFAHFSGYFSCFFDSSMYPCPSEVSLITGCNFCTFTYHT